MCKKWFINVSEEPDAKNTTLDSLEQDLNKFSFGVNLFLVFASTGKIKNTFDNNSYQTKSCFKLVPVSIMVIRFLDQFSTLIHSTDARLIILDTGRRLK